MRPVLIATLVAAFVSGRQSAWGMEVTACGQTVPEHETGTLQADLDCTGSPGICFYYIVEQPEQDVPCTSDADCQDLPPGGRCSHVGVSLQRGATLDLNGHTLTGAGVLCQNQARCAITGGGEIVGAQGFGIYGRENLTVSDVVVRDGDYIGIMALRGKMLLKNVQANHNYAFGINNVDGKIVVENVTANDNLFNNGVNSSFGTVRGVGLTTTGNNSVGVTAKRIVLRGLRAVGNTEYGVITGRIRLIDSTLIDNGAGSPDPLDIYLTDTGYRHPTIKLFRTICGYSNAGVCDND